MKKLICNTKFKLDAMGDGGSKRSVQIREILSSNGIEFKDDSFALPKGSSKKQLIIWSLRAISFIHKHYPHNNIQSLSNYWNIIKYYALRIPIIIDKYAQKDVAFLWENTNDRKMVYLMKASGHPVIGLPHNIESLVSSHSISALGREIQNLVPCDMVFAISKEETWLLRLLGINAYYLPYYPPLEVETFLLSIRNSRERKKFDTGKRFMLLGSATNIPTRSGMQSLIDYAAKQDLSFDIFVAGYGTESLKKVDNSHIIFLGSISNEKLKQMLIEVDAVLIYQPPTTGALTRIPEMLIAGVPVFANFDATRNYHGINGIYGYNSFEELIIMLEHVELKMPERQLRDQSAEKQFIDSII